MFETDIQNVSMIVCEEGEMPEELNMLKFPKGEGETILVVEDEEMLRDFLQAVLVENGYKVVLASDGTEAVRKFAEQIDRIDLVLLDMGLPRLSGGEVLSMILALKSYVKVIAVSGSIEPEVQSAALEIGAADYLSKPYLSGEILLRVHNTLHNKAKLDG